MNTETLTHLFARSAEEFALLEEGTEGFLRSLTAGQNAEYDSFNAWRQKVVAGIQKLDSEIRLGLSGTNNRTAGTGALLNDYRKLQENRIHRILEMDAAIITIAGERLAAVRNEFTNLARGRHALHGYGSAVRTSGTFLDSKA